MAEGSLRYPRTSADLLGQHGLVLQKFVSIRWIVRIVCGISTLERWTSRLVPFLALSGLVVLLLMNKGTSWQEFPPAHPTALQKTSPKTSHSYLFVPRQVLTSPLWTRALRATSTTRPLTDCEGRNGQRSEQNKGNRKVGVRAEPGKPIVCRALRWRQHLLPRHDLGFSAS